MLCDAFVFFTKSGRIAAYAHHGAGAFMQVMMDGIADVIDQDIDVVLAHKPVGPAAVAVLGGDDAIKAANILEIFFGFAQRCACGGSLLFRIFFDNDNRDDAATIGFGQQHGQVPGMGQGGVRRTAVQHKPFFCMVG